MLKSMGSQRVGYDLVTEQQQQHEPSTVILVISLIVLLDPELLEGMGSAQ